MRKITLIPGDGIGPEVIDATMRIFKAAGVALDLETCEAGAKVFKSGDATGVPKETADSIARNRVVLKGPLETPVGFGEKSANVTLRKMFELFANIRPVRELPGIQTPFSGRGIDLVVVRENVEDLYAGIEHMQSPSVAQTLKIISRMGSEKVIRTAFGLAQAEGRKTVHCATKSNIMKLAEGMFKRTFEAVAPDYPGLEAQHIIIDNCAHQLVIRPEAFDVIVTTNLNGDIVSDLTSGLVGGLGVAPGANLGQDIAIFEAVHGSAPDIAGKDMANPTATLLSGIMMLRYLGLFEAAQAIEQALFVSFENGQMTRDLRKDQGLGTRGFTEAVIANLGKTSGFKTQRAYQRFEIGKNTLPEIMPSKRSDIGADIFIETLEGPAKLGQTLDKLCADSPLRLKMISNRGTRVYPGEVMGTDMIDVYRCRFILRDTAQSLLESDLLALLDKVSSKYRWMHIEKLLEMDGAAGYTKAQGES